MLASPARLLNVDGADGEWVESDATGALFTTEDGAAVDTAPRAGAGGSVAVVDGWVRGATLADAGPGFTAFLNEGDTGEGAAVGRTVRIAAADAESSLAAGESFGCATSAVVDSEAAGVLLDVPAEPGRASMDEVAFDGARISTGFG